MFGLRQFRLSLFFFARPNPRLALSKANETVPFTIN
jgi:hypothetical protein